MNNIIEKYNLPHIPSWKKFESNITEEQKIALKCLDKKPISKEEEQVLKKAVEFYRIVFPLLKSIDLAIISLEDAQELQKYLSEIFNLNAITSNDIRFETVFRISIIKEGFLEKGKVRSPKYLKYPPLDVIRETGVFNRANTTSNTVFYASFDEHVALREAKPQKGEKIIRSVWKNSTDNSFASYPITNSNIKNEGVLKATKHFTQIKSTINSSVAEIMDLQLAFLASEFVKDCAIINPNRLEYLFSAHFSDKYLSPLKNTSTLLPGSGPLPNYDLIIYPSVAWNHQYENIAMSAASLDSKMQIVRATEYEVEETYYDKDLTIDETPAKLRFIREATWFEKDLIIWEDE